MFFIGLQVMDVLGVTQWRTNALEVIDSKLGKNLDHIYSATQKGKIIKYMLVASIPLLEIIFFMNTHIFGCIGI